MKKQNNFMRYVLFAVTIATLGLLAFAFANPAHAAYIEVPGTPRATILDPVGGGSRLIGVWAEHSPAGDFVAVFEKDPIQGWIAIWTSNPVYPAWDASYRDPSVALGYIYSQLSGINGAIANRFAVRSNGPTPTGQPTLDAVNKVLYDSFTFRVNPDGSAVFTTK